MYKSSKLTFFFKYFFPLLLIGGLSLFMLMGATKTDSETRYLFLGIACFSGLSLTFIILIPFKLMHIVADKEGLSIKDSKKEFKVDYRYVHWVSKSTFPLPIFPTVKYYDPVTGLDKKVNFISDQMYQSAFGNDAMVEFIQSQVEKNNPSYSKKNKPKRIDTILLMIYLNIPFILAGLYFINKSIHFIDLPF